MAPAVHAALCLGMSRLDVVHHVGRQGLEGPHSSFNMKQCALSVTSAFFCGAVLAVRGISALIGSRRMLTMCSGEEAEFTQVCGLHCAKGDYYSCAKKW